ncbi:MAG: type III pantothenate kinase [Desulfobulbaceae bacterium]|uniref:Type III pantothenate kinase n=1 Tax=Candidatus Desulfatifera sulfidica TaxID=2841691 RepID=A0A8J6N7E6_9BACT|nr:type III pantothenate kinase [Candidatus Desulfatifera sulfidica]
MLFVVDIGNSHTVSGLFRDGELMGHWRLNSDRDRSDDELALRYHALFAMIGIDKNEITNIVIASVVPTLEAAWVSCCDKYFSSSLIRPPLVVSAKSLHKQIKILIDQPDEVGADRLVNAIAAWDQYHQDLVIIDFGTAITFDCVTADCSYLGGTILPGIAISLDALASRTAKLPRIDISSPPENVIGTSTVTAMKSGILHGYGAMIDGLLIKIAGEMKHSVDELQVIATGGMARLISPYAKNIKSIDPLLTLNGLRIIHEMTSND